MSKTATVYARVEPEIKEQAEAVLNKLGISMSEMVDMVLRQIVYQQRIPFEISLPKPPIPCLDEMTLEEFNAELQKGLDDIAAGRVVSADELKAEFFDRYGVRL